MSIKNIAFFGSGACFGEAFIYILATNKDYMALIQGAIGIAFLIFALTTQED